MNRAIEIARKDIEDREDKRILGEVWKVMLNVLIKKWNNMRKKELVAELVASEKMHEAQKDVLRDYERTMGEMRSQLTESAQHCKALQDGLTRERRIVDALTK